MLASRQPLDGGLRPGERSETLLLVRLAGLSVDPPGEREQSYARGRDRSDNGSENLCLDSSPTAVTVSTS